MTSTSDHMPIKLLRLLVLALCLLVLPSAGIAKPLLRISTENEARHHQTRTVDRFVNLVRTRAGNLIDLDFRHSAALFRDRDVIDAMLRDQIEMAVPGLWQLDRFLPDIGIFLLPMFYGRSSGEIHDLLGRDLGERFRREFAERLDLQMLGDWLDLGYVNLYFRDQVRGYDDIRQMKIRTAGGEANAARIRAMGADPVVVPWPDLVPSLVAGRIDGLLSSHESLVSASLWRYGIRTAFEDREFFAQYVPLISGRFWRALPRHLQLVLSEAWRTAASEGRVAAATSQEEARRRLAEAGVEIIVPAAADTERMRRNLLSVQDELVANLRIDLELVRLLAAQLAVDR